MVSAIDEAPRSVPAQAFLSLAVGLYSVSYFLWTPLDVSMRAIGPVGASIAVGVAALAMVVFVSVSLLVRPAQGDGQRLQLAVLLFSLSWGVTLVLNGGVLGPAKFTGNFPFRVVTVIFALLAGHRLGASLRLKPWTGALVGGGIVLTVAGMMIVAWMRGVTVDAYRNQGVQPIGTASGEAIQVYLVAFASPLLLLIRSTAIRVVLYLTAVAAVVATFRRGPLVCVLLPLVLMALLDRRRLSGRRWYVDFLTFSGAGILASIAIGVDKLFARWIAIFDGTGYSLSERDVIYPALLSQVVPLDIHTVFGHGVGSTVEMLGRLLGRDIFAHNDWLELLVSVGLFGVAAFALIHVFLLLAVFRALRKNRRVGLVAAALYGQLFLASWLEGVLYGAQHGALLLFFLGAAIGWSEMGTDQKLPGKVRKA